jgi:2-polyprenyl-3-methyl-5-hydroxy-6-metoxy-1,4-benzoquinol methylase
MNLTTRSYEKELLDKDDIPFSDILTLMQELNIINTSLGGHNITRKGIDFFLDNTQPGQKLIIAEIGCGGGDNLTAVDDFLKKINRDAALIGVDIKQECLQFAQQHVTADVQWICSDYRKVIWPGRKPDVIFSSLFCHHFTDEQLTEQLKWLRENSSMGFFINDLHRNAIAYFLIKQLTRFFSRSYLVKNDGPLSVKRAFKRKDWVRILAAAGIKKYTIKWQWAFRFLICVPHEQ